MFTTFNYLIKSTVRGYRTKSIDIDSHLQMERFNLCFSVMLIYNHRQFFLGRLLDKATESGSQIETSAHLLLWYVKTFACRQMSSCWQFLAIVLNSVTYAALFSSGSCLRLLNR